MKKHLLINWKFIIRHEKNFKQSSSVLLGNNELNVGFLNRKIEKKELFISQNLDDIFRMVMAFSH